MRLISNSIASAVLAMFGHPQMDKVASCDVLLNGPDALWEQVSVEVFFGNVGGESIFIQIPVSQFEKPEMNGSGSGVHGTLKAFPYVMVMGGRLYASSASGEGNFVPLTIKELSAGKHRNKTDEELKSTLHSMSDGIPGIRVFTQPKGEAR